MSLNRLTLIGADVETKTANAGSKFAAFSVATKWSWKNADGGWESRTEWHRCIAFGKLGEFAATLKKGAHVQVEGELRSREYGKERHYPSRLRVPGRIDPQARPRSAPGCSGIRR